MHQRCRWSSLGFAIKKLVQKTYRGSVYAAATLVSMVGVFLVAGLYASHSGYAADADTDLQNVTLNLSRQLNERIQSIDLILQVASQ